MMLRFIWSHPEVAAATETMKAPIYYLPARDGLLTQFVMLSVPRTNGNGSLSPGTELLRPAPTLLKLYPPFRRLQVWALLDIDICYTLRPHLAIGR